MLNHLKLQSHLILIIPDLIYSFALMIFAFKILLKLARLGVGLFIGNIPNSSLTPFWVLLAFWDFWIYSPSLVVGALDFIANGMVSELCT